MCTKVLVPNEIKIIDIKDNNKIYGSLIYNKDQDTIYFINKSNVSQPLIGKRQIIKSNENSDSLKYNGIWDQEVDYKINTIVKYRNRLYISKNNITDKCLPYKSEEWELLFKMNNNVKDVLRLKLSSKESISIQKNMQPLLFTHDVLPEFIEYIEASKSYYILKSGNYQVIYNLAFNTNASHFKVLFFLMADKEKPKQIEDGSSYINNINDTNNTNINHNFIIQIDNELDTTDDSFSFEQNTSHKILLSIRFDDTELGKYIKFIQNESWISIYNI